jgi:hypothetical protein
MAFFQALNAGLVLPETVELYTESVDLVLKKTREALTNWNRRLHGAKASEIGIGGIDGAADPGSGE